jgi:D-alanyl-D-alanine carboxypeptidase/D-alanyl-D-alanine-endopeptidase (penicillin-binding protein 4)
VFDHLKKYNNIRLYTEVYTDFLGNGWSWNDYTEAYMAQRSDLPVYGNVARFTLAANGNVNVMPSYFLPDIMQSNDTENGFNIEKPWDTNNFFVSPGNDKAVAIPFNPNHKTIADILSDTLKMPVEIDPFHKFQSKKIIHSQATDSMLRLMMFRSDNFYAEQTLLMVSNERLNTLNDARIIDTTLKTDFADLPQKPRWVDGSGLSRYNLFTPKSMVAILNKMHSEFGMDRIKRIFPTGGQGTISSYYKSDSGYIYGKTGTLSGVVAFSGFLITKNNKLLIFSVLVNNHQASATDIRKAIEKFLLEVRFNY